jgi:nucleoside-diphosphate-sugar epimerase
MSTRWSDFFHNRFRGVGVLVTGGAGFIGSHLSDALLSLGAKVNILDDMSGGLPSNIEFLSRKHPTRLRAITGSILDDNALKDATEGCAYVFHQAALGSVPRSMKEPLLYMNVNITGTLKTLQAAQAAGVKRVMFAASSSAYGDTPTLPKFEEMPTLPKSPYAVTKVAGEGLMRTFAASYGLDTISLRYFNIFGPRQNPNSAYAAVIAAFAKALIASQRPVIFGDGLQSRDFTYVDNAVYANLLAALSPSPTAGAVLNVACGQSVNLNQIAEKMAGLMGRSDLTPVYQPQRAGDVKHSLASLDNIHKFLTYSPIVNFDQGMALAVEDYSRTLK